jgi:hypothetical protein
VTATPGVVPACTVAMPSATPPRLGQLDELAVARARAGDQHLIHIIAQTYTPVREE